MVGRPDDLIGDTIQDEIEHKSLELQRAGLLTGPRDVEAWLFRLKMHLFMDLGYKPDKADKKRWEHGDLAKRPCQQGMLKAKKAS